MFGSFAFVYGLACAFVGKGKCAKCAEARKQKNVWRQKIKLYCVGWSGWQLLSFVYFSP